ncbi:MAG: ester cyclase [Anaerolineae bacterium]|nr:ester cyclase [Anaerolineae bacterium]
MRTLRFLYLLLVLGLVIGLMPAAAQEEDPREINRETTINWLEFVRDAGNFELMTDLVAPRGYVLHNPSAITGIDASIGEVVGSTVELKTAFPNLSVRDYLVLAEGDMTAAIFFDQGTFVNPYYGAEPTGETYFGQYINLKRFEEGKIAEDWWAWNTQEFNQVLGQSPAQYDFAIAPWDTWLGESETTTGTHRSTLRILYNALSIHYPDVAPSCAPAGMDVRGEPMSVDSYLEMLPHYYAGNVVVHDYMMTFGGIDMFTQNMRAIATLPGFRTNCAQFVCEGNLCASWSVAQVTTDAGETPFVWAALHRFADGKIVEEWWLYDNALLLPMLSH